MISKKLWETARYWRREQDYEATKKQMESESQNAQNVHEQTTLLVECLQHDLGDIYVLFNFEIKDHTDLRVWATHYGIEDIHIRLEERNDRYYIEHKNRTTEVASETLRDYLLARIAADLEDVRQSFFAITECNYHMNTTEYIDELHALADEIQQTEQCPQSRAYMRASGIINALLSYAKQWDEQAKLEYAQKKLQLHIAVRTV